tara:strand:- start:274 stop:1608 length:1335 start_codon:yes stop_codon:yes gene_type:complete
MNFTKVQQAAFDSYLNGENIFITGSGGVGKSYFIQKLYNHAKELGKRIHVTSMTGCSAILLNCNATTLHKWGCFGLGKGCEEEIYRNVVTRKKKDNYNNTDILVIDEISMLNEKMFEVLNYICQKVRKNEEVFGGIQMICCGDFYQLPPVCKDRTNVAESNFCFQSNTWEKTFHNSYLFDVNFRQNNDPTYFNMLQEIREGKVSFDTVGELVLCSKKVINPADSIKPTKIFPIRSMVEKVNKEEIDKLTTKKYYYPCKYYCDKEEIVNLNQCKDKHMKTEIEYTMTHSIFEKELTICEGSQVMCIYNMDQENNIVNGSQGIVKSFTYDPDKNRHYPIVKFDNVELPVTVKEHEWFLDSKNKYSIQQIPLVLSWAITTHKSQGLSIEKALIDIGSNIFEYGQTYVALSRVKSLEGLYLTKVNPSKIKAHPRVVEFYKQFKKQINS